MLPSQAPALKPAEFDQIRRWLYDASGIQLREGKESLVVARLQRHLRSGGHSSYASLLEQAKRDRSGELLTLVLDALTTNHTGFLRERCHFDFLSDQIVPQMAGAGPLRIWSAACATGQEPYSIACTLMSKPSRLWSSLPQILASDLSTRALTGARQGRYTIQQCRDLPNDWRSRFFATEENGGDVLFAARPELTRMIEFKQINLMHPLGQLGTFHVIFCRNVMLYFDQETQAKLVERLTACLAPRGYLFIGHSETPAGANPLLEYIQPAVYRLRR